MQALRAGFKRIDNKRNKGKKCNQTATDLLTDQSDWPILNFEDSNCISPAKVPISWITNSLQDDLHLPNESGGFRLRDCRHRESIEPLMGGPIDVKFSTTWQSTTEYDENIPPVDDHTIRKVINKSRWKQDVQAGESKQPLLVESTTYSSKEMLDEQFSPILQDTFRQQSIEHSEKTKPLGGRPTNSSIRSMPRKRTTKFDNLQKIILLKQNDKPIEDEYRSATIPQNSKQVTYVGAFDPFENTEFEGQNRENHFRRLHNTSTSNFKPFSSESSEIEQVREVNKEQKGSRCDISSPSEMMESGSCASNRSIVSPKHPTENYFAQDYTAEHFSLNNFTTEKGAVALSSQGEEMKPCIDGLVADSTVRNRRACRRGTDHTEDDINSSGEYLKRGRITSDLDVESTAKMRDTIDFGNVSTNFRGEKCSVERIASTSSSVLHEAESLRKDTIDQIAATGTISEMKQEDENQSRLRFVALLSNFSATLKQRAEQERAISILEGSNIRNIEKVDGSAPCNISRRNLLFKISGERGKYPQFFLQKDHSIIIYLGDYEWIQYMNDIGSLTNETVFGVPNSQSLHNESEMIDTVKHTDGEVSKNNKKIPDDLLAIDIVPNPTFSERALAFDMYKRGQSSDNITSPDCRRSNIGNLSCEEQEMSCLDLETNSVALNENSLVNGVPGRIESFSVAPLNKDIAVVDVEANEHLKDCTGINENNAEFEESHSKSSCNESPKLVPPKSQSIYTEMIVDAEIIPSTESLASIELAPTPELYDNQSIMEGSSSEQTREQRKYETISTSFNHESEKRSTILTSTEGHKDIEPTAHKDIESTNGDVLQFSFRSSNFVESERNATADSKRSRSPTVSPIMNGEENGDSENMKAAVVANVFESSVDTKSSFDKVTKSEKFLIIDIPLHRNEIIDTGSDFEKPELPRVDRDEKETKAQEVEDCSIQPMDDDKNLSSSENEEPIGASLNEIDMINKFLTILGPDYDGSLITDENLEDVHDRSGKAGLTKTFTNKMPNQSADIQKLDGPDIANVQPSPDLQAFETKCNEVSKSVPTSNISNDTYDDREFTRKTPKEQSKMDCLVDTFWAESSNIVGGDMIQNIQAALSGDSESKRGWRSNDTGETNSRWPSVDMIGSIKASLSGESSEKRWQSSGVIQSIKAALSGDSENRSGTWSSDIPNENPLAESTKKRNNLSCGSEEILQSFVVETDSAADAHGNSTLYEC